MPPRSRKRKSSTSDPDAAKDAPAPKKTARAPARKPARAKAGGRMSEYAVDEGRNSSRSFLNTTKRSRVAHEAKKEIHKKTESLIEFIESQHTGVLSATDDTASVHTSAREIAAMVPYSSMATDAPAMYDDGIDDKTLGCLENVQKTVKEYEALNKHDSHIKQPTWMRWKQDAADLRALNHETVGIAGRVVNGIIMPKPYAGLAKPSDDASDIETMAWEMLEDGRPSAGEETWGTMAQGLVKAFTAVSKLAMQGKAD